MNKFTIVLIMLTISVLACKVQPTPTATPTEQTRTISPMQSDITRLQGVPCEECE